MVELSKTAKASMKGIKGPDNKDPFDTNEQKINELRKLLAGRLFVTRQDFIVALLEEYDKLMQKKKGYELGNPL